MTGGKSACTYFCLGKEKLCNSLEDARLAITPIANIHHLRDTYILYHAVADNLLNVVDDGLVSRILLKHGSEQYKLTKEKGRSDSF